MATPPRVSDDPTTQRQYVTHLVLTAALMQAIRSLWGSLTPLSAVDAWEAFRNATHAVVPQYASAAAVVSLDNYRIARTAAGAKGEPRIDLLGTPPASKIDAGLDWAQRAMGDVAGDLAAQLKEIEAAQQAEFAEIEAKVLARAEAAMQKVLMDEARAQTVAAVEGDEFALGFRRIPRPDACYFCIVQAFRKTSRIGRASKFPKYGTPGALDPDAWHYGVYKSRESAGGLANAQFEGTGTAKFHNNCHCTIEPVFFPVTSLPDWLADMEQLYDDTPGGLNEFRKALNARRGGHEPVDPLPTIPAPSAAQGAQAAAISELLSRLAA